MIGSKIVLPGRYTPESLANILINEGVIVSAGAPAILIPLLEVFRKIEPKPKLNNLRFLSGATEPPLALMMQLKEFGINIVHAYGATETAPLIVANLPKKKIKQMSEQDQIENARKQGLPLFGVEVKIVDPAGRELPWDGKSVGGTFDKRPVDSKSIL